MRVRKAPNYDGVCFHAQQCAEKYLKALLQENGQRFAKIHDLSALLKQLTRVSPALVLLDSAAKALNDYAVEFRYPGKSADKALAREALRYCTLIRESTRAQLGLSASTSTQYSGATGPKKAIRTPRAKRS
ncbi:MAG: HEPN domain-containing protein [Planctomycetes bacterium]|nr:HEPN domain-containing protein [Planctomycetota bacterium]